MNKLVLIIGKDIISEKTVMQAKNIPHATIRNASDESWASYIFSVVFFFINIIPNTNSL